MYDRLRGPACNNLIHSPLEPWGLIRISSPAHIPTTNTYLWGGRKKGKIKRFLDLIVHGFYHIYLDLGSSLFPAPPPPSCISFFLFFFFILPQPTNRAPPPICPHTHIRIEIYNDIMISFPSTRGAQKFFRFLFEISGRTRKNGLWWKSIILNVNKIILRATSTQLLLYNEVIRW